MPIDKRSTINNKVMRFPKSFFGVGIETFGGLWEFNKDDQLNKNTGEPLTAEDRVNRLFDRTEYPSYQEIVEIIHDAEFDTLNFPKIIAKRHGQ